MDKFWKCDGKTVGYDGHPAVYLPLSEKCPYCGNTKDNDGNTLPTDLSDSE